MQISDSNLEQMNQNFWKYNQRVFIFYKFLDFLFLFSWLFIPAELQAFGSTFSSTPTTSWIYNLKSFYAFLIKYI